jgi:formylglycine-generating enzyme required for sulfatase activity
VYRHAQSGELVLHDLCGLVFVLIPPGTCLIGEQPSDPRKPRYDPDAAVYSEPFEFEFAAFFMSKYEMTQAQWWHLSGENPAKFRIGSRHFGDPQTGYRHPVESVSAVQCDELLREFGLMLPADAQWEYACGAGTVTKWSFGNDPSRLCDHGNVDDRAHAHQLGLPGGVAGDDGMVATAPVGGHAANPFGLHDVYGNVAEWCRDTCVDHAASVPMPGDGYRLPPAPNGHRAMRGGHYAQAVTTARRLGAPPEFRNQAIGLRPVQVLKGASR